ncbi:hypothetical protein PFISCL1PPCAC_21149, partial [Pristionchus fissidentatus]
TLESLLNSMKAELELAFANDDNRSELLRNLLYSFCTGLSSSIASIIEVNQQDNRYGVSEAAVQADVIDNAVTSKQGP